jgi:hypothetical protein
VHRASASVFLFCDIKISIGANGITYSYVFFVSTPETIRQDPPARIYISQDSPAKTTSTGTSTGY